MTFTEAETRAKIIDEKLRLAGWNVRDPSQVIQELEIDLSEAGAPRVAEPKTPYKVHQFADYGLLLNVKPIAVVEAKKTSKDAALGQEQALLVACRIGDIIHLVKQAVGPEQGQVDGDTGRRLAALCLHHRPTSGADFLRDLRNGQVAAQPCRAQIRAQALYRLLDSVRRGARQYVLSSHVRFIAR